MFRLRNKNDGFTLIEMMVVIAIIGFLSASILAGVSSARKRARDTRIQAIVQQAMSIPEGFYDPANGKYEESSTNFGGAGSEWENLDRQIRGLRNVTVESIFYRGGTNQYVIWAPLLTSKFYCVDANGRAKVIANQPTDTVCP